MLRALMLPVDAHDPPSCPVIEQLNAVDPAHEGLGIVLVVARFIGAPNVCDVAKLFGPTRDFLLVKSIPGE